MGKGENSGSSETIATCDLKVGRCRQLIDIYYGKVNFLNFSII